MPTKKFPVNLNNSSTALCPAGRDICPLEDLKGVAPLGVVVQDPQVVNDLNHNGGDVADVHVVPH
jgi:hypothetical protein